MSDIESLLGKYPNIISAISAFGTLLAVIVSLSISIVSQRATRTKLRSRMTIRGIYHKSLGHCGHHRYVTVNIVNQGLMPARIPLYFFNYKVPFRRESMFILPMDYAAGDALVPQKKYPIEIMPKHSESFFLSGIEAFRENIIKGTKEISLIERLFFKYFFQAYIISDDGKKFNVVINKHIKNEIWEIITRI